MELISPCGTLNLPSGRKLVNRMRLFSTLLTLEKTASFILHFWVVVIALVLRFDHPLCSAIFIFTCHFEYTQ